MSDPFSRVADKPLGGSGYNFDENMADPFNRKAKPYSKAAPVRKDPFGRPAATASQPSPQKVPSRQPSPQKVPSRQPSPQKKVASRQPSPQKKAPSPKKMPSPTKTPQDADDGAAATKKSKPAVEKPWLRKRKKRMPRKKPAADAGFEVLVAGPPPKSKPNPTNSDQDVVAAASPPANEGSATVAQVEGSSASPPPPPSQQVASDHKEAVRSDTVDDADDPAAPQQEAKQDSEMVADDSPIPAPVVELAAPASPKPTTRPRRQVPPSPAVGAGSGPGSSASGGLLTGGDPMEGAPRAPQTFDGPLEQRLTHKNWKARMQAYGELQKELEQANDGSDPVFNRYASFFASICKDSNAPCLDKGLEALAVFVEEADGAENYFEDVSKGLVEKALGARAGTRQKAHHILLTFVELGVAEQVVAYVGKACYHRQWKIAVAAAALVTDALKLFGPRVVQIKSLEKLIPKMFGHSNAKVRQAAVVLTGEIYRWLGEHFSTGISKLKLRPAQEKECLVSFEEIEVGQARPERRLRSDQAKQPQDGAPGGQSTNQDEAFDPLSLVEAVDVCAQLSKGWTESVLQAPKWKVKKDKLVELKTAAQTCSKIAVTGELQNVVNTLTTLFKDNNVMVVAETCKATLALIKGCRADFSGFSKALVASILPLLKEKKATVNAPATECLDALFDLCISSLGEVLDDTLLHLNHKVPKVRKETSEWILRCLQHAKTTEATLGDAAKPLGDQFYRNTSFPDGAVRDVAVQALGCMIALVGERPFKKVLAKCLSENVSRHKKIMALGKGAPIEAASSSSAVPAPTAKKRSAPVKAKPSALARPGSKPKKPSQAVAKSGSSSSTRAAPTSRPKASAPSAVVPDTGSALEFADAQAKLVELLGKAQVDQLAAKKWSECVEALSSITDTVGKMDGAAVTSLADPLFYTLAKTPKFGPNNFNVCKAVYVLCAAVATAMPHFPRRLVALPMKDLLSKMGDRKIVTQLGACLDAFAECVGPTFVFSLIAKHTAKLTNVKALEAVIGWVSACVSEFGIRAMDVKEVVGTVKTWLEHRQKGVRQAATEVFVCMYKEAGKPLVAMMLKGLKPALAAEIQQRFDAVPPEEVGVSKASKRVKGTHDTESAAAAAAAGGDMDDIIPRNDIAGQITSKLIAKLGDSNWKIRKEGLDAVVNILDDAGHRIQPTVGGLFDALKPRLSDKNKNLVKQTLQLVATLCHDMGPSISRYSSRVVPGLLSALGDSKKHIKDQARQATEAWLSICGLQSTARFLPKALALTPVREQLLQLVHASLETGVQTGHEPLALRDTVLSVLECLLDKTSAVRALAEKVLLHLADLYGMRCVKGATSGLKKAEKLSLAPVMDKLSKQAGNPRAAQPPTMVESAIPGARPSSKRSGVARAKGKSSLRPKAMKRGARAATKSQPAAATSTTADSGGCIKPSSRAEKIKRLKRESKRLKGSFRDLALDEIEELKENFAMALSPSLKAQLFHQDFKHQIQGIQVLKTALAEEHESFLSVLDLVLKWCAWRMCDANTSLLIAILKFLKSAIKSMADQGSKIHDAEAGILLPHLIEKVFGHNRDTFRGDCQTVLRDVCLLYPQSKVFDQLLSGLQSKNKRVQSECLEEMGMMISRFGVNVMGSQSKVFPMIGKFVGSGDKNVRSSALNALQRAYSIEGEKLWKHLGGKGDRCKLEDKSKSMVVARFQRTKVLGPDASMASPAVRGPTSRGRTPQATPARSARTSARKGVSRPGSARQSPLKIPTALANTPAPANSKREAISPAERSALPNCFSLDLDAIGAPPAASAAPHTRTAVPTAAAESFLSWKEKHSNALENNGSAAPPQANTQASASLGERGQLEPRLFRYLETGDEDQRIEAMKHIWSRIGKVGAKVVRPHTDRLCRLLRSQVDQSFVEDGQEVQVRHRLCKYALNTMMEMFKVESVAQEVHVDTLELLMRELLQRLLDERLRHQPDGRGLVKGLNVLMLKVLENADRTSSFHVLLKFLRERQSSMTGFTALVVKCLLKLTKKLPESIHRINLSIVLGDVHDFLEAAPYGRDEMPTKSVRTTVSELVKLKGDSLRNYIDLPADSALSQYISRMSDSQEASRQTSVPPLTPVSHGQNVSSPAVGGVGSYRDRLRMLQDSAREQEREAATNEVGTGNVHATASPTAVDQDRLSLQQLRSRLPSSVQKKAASRNADEPVSSIEDIRARYRASGRGDENLPQNSRPLSASERYAQRRMGNTPAKPALAAVPGSATRDLSDIKARIAAMRRS